MSLQEKKRKTLYYTTNATYSMSVTLSTNKTDHVTRSVIYVFGELFGTFFPVPALCIIFVTLMCFL